MPAESKVRQFLRQHASDVATAGVAIVGGATVLSGVLYLIRRQIQQGDVLSVRLVHDIDPETRQLVENYLPVAEKMVDQGVDMNIRLFRRSKLQ